MTAVRLTHIGGPTMLIEVTQGREEVERAFATAPEDVRRSIRWLPIGDAAEIAA